jgi:hypothetical protein
VLTPEQLQQIADRDVLVEEAALATHAFVISHPEMRVLPMAYQTRMIMEATIGFLLSETLIQVTPDWPECLGMGLPGHLQPDVAAVVARHLGTAR